MVLYPGSNVESLPVAQVGHLRLPYGTDLDDLATNAAFDAVVVVVNWLTSREQTEN